jgi:hypothetical protein
MHIYQSDFQVVDLMEAPLSPPSDEMEMDELVEKMSWLPKEQEALRMFLSSLNSTDGMGMYRFLSEQPAEQARLKRGRFRRSITANACLRALRAAAAKGTPQMPTLAYSSDDKLLRPSRSRKSAIAAQQSAFGNWLEGSEGIMLFLS